MPRSVLLHSSHPRLLLPRAAIRRAVELLDAAAADFRGGAPAGELSLAFLTDDALAALHGQFLDDPSRTDVITFEGEPAFGAAGEICVSVDTAARVARVRKQPFARELTLYLVHGWLHLAGYDDLQPAKKRQMRAAEARAMKLLDRHDAVPPFRLKSKR